MPWSKSISITRSAITHSRPIETCWNAEIVHSWPITVLAPISTQPSWIGPGTKIRCPDGCVEIGAKTVMGQECTISAFQHVSIGRECVIADRVMLIDFDHGMVEVERPVRLQGIYKRDVRVGNNVWIGYGACILRGVTVGDN